MQIEEKESLFAVAPFTGAWIEMFKAVAIIDGSTVAPFTGAWIEMSQAGVATPKSYCRTLHGCVD